MNQPPVQGLPAITVKAEAQYILGFPILVAVTLHNETPDTDFLILPELGLLSPIDSLALVIKPLDGGPTTKVGPSFEFRDRDLFRTELLAGETKQMLIDLSQFGQPFNSGKNEIYLSIFDGPTVSRSSTPVKVEFVEPSTEERNEASRLRRLGLRTGVVDSGSWQPFLTNNWNTVSLEQFVGESAAQQLALHLFSHLAAYGPEPLERLPLDILPEIQGPVLSAELALLEYEMLAARKNKVEIEDSRSRLLQTWPGLEFRILQIEKGEGFLTTLRRGYGAERDSSLTRAGRPYLEGE